MDELQELAKAAPDRRAQRASELLTSHLEQVEELSRIRREALYELIAAGWGQTRIADLLNVTRARVGQILTSGTQPERALLGTGSLTVAVASRDSPQRPTDPAATVSEENTQAFQLLAATASGYDLTAKMEVVRPPGIVDLARPNLIVLGSPKRLPTLMPTLGADPHLGFGHGDAGWYLTEDGRVHRSPSDQGMPVDYAYVGRLPRPDHKGTFLYLAGIHSAGTLGAVHYLTSNISDIYTQVKARRWSTLIECRFDPDTRQIQSTERITQIYTVPKQGPGH